MKLRLGQPVYSTDGVFGEVGDIVIDPLERTVTHLVVEPHHQHQQARLVPIWLVSVEGDDVHVDLTAKHIRQLQRVALREFVELGQPVAVGDGWDLGTEEVLALPYWDFPGLGTVPDSGLVDVAYDRVPKGECEIRRRSEVVTSDERRIGHVEGLLADGEHLVAIVVRTGLPGLHHNVVVPISKVRDVANDRISLHLDKVEFERLPSGHGLEGPMGKSQVESFEHHAAKVAARIHDGLKGAGARTRNLIRR